MKSDLIGRRSKVFSHLHFSLTLRVHFHSTFKSCSLCFNPTVTTTTTTRWATCHSNLIGCRRRRHRVPVSRFINDCKPAGNKIRTWPAAYSWLHNINNNLSPRAAAAATWELVCIVFVVVSFSFLSYSTSTCLNSFKEWNKTPLHHRHVTLRQDETRLVHAQC